MTSKISSYKIAIEDMRHRAWMLALSCLGSFLALPVTFLLAMRNYQDYISRAFTNDPDRIHQLLQSAYIRFFLTESVITEGIILSIGAFIVGIFGFRHLYSRKMADLYHSVPVKRSRMFLITYVNGLLIWLIPMLASIGITLVIAFVTLGAPAYFPAIAAASGKVVLVFLFCFLIIYHLCLTAVMISGNEFNAICSALIMGTVIAAIYGIIYGFCQAFLNTFIVFPISTDKVLWASPLVSVVMILLKTSDTRYFSGFALQAVLSALLSAGQFAASWRLYLTRPSELAERGIQNKWFQNSLRIAGSLALGLCGGGVFLMVLGRENVLGWCVFGIILCTVFSFGVMNIIFHMNIKSFFSHKLQMLGTTLAACFILLAISLDWTGYNTRIPSKDQIISAAIYVSGYTDYSYALQSTEAGSLTKQDIEAYECDMNYTDTEEIYNALVSLSASPQANSEPWISTASVKVNLKNGSSFYRRYPVFPKDREIVRAVVESEQYRNTFYKLSAGQLPLPDTINVDGMLIQATNYVKNPEEISDVMAAYQKDFSEHYSMEELRSGAIVCHLSMFYDSGEYSTYYDLDVYDNYTSTLDVLKELFPAMQLTALDLEIDAIELRPDVDPTYPADSLYSYFGADGYPSYEEYVYEINNQEGDDTDAHSNDTDIRVSGPQAEVVDNDSSHPHYGLKVTDPDGMEELLTMIHVGSNFSKYYFSQQYCYLGEVILKDGSSLNCYVKEGEFPKKWIEKLKLAEQ